MGKNLPAIKNSIAIAALLIPLCAAAQSVAPFDFKGIQIGMDRAAVTALTPIQCTTDTPNADGQLHCFGRGDLARTIAGAKLRSLFLVFDEGTLSDIIANFSSDDADAVLTALQSKYGKPDSSLTSDFTTRIGTHYENLRVTWKSGEYRMTYRRFTDSINNSAVSYTSETALRRFMERTDRQKAERAKDL